MAFNLHIIDTVIVNPTEKDFINAIEILKKDGILEKGDTVVLAGGAKILPDNTENKVMGGFVRLQD